MEQATESRLAYGLNEAAWATCSSRDFICEEIKQGRLKAFKAGARKVLITAADLNDWLASRRESHPLPTNAEEQAA